MYVTGLRMHLRCGARHRGALLEEGGIGYSESPGSEAKTEPTCDKLLWRKQMMRMTFVSEASL